MSIFKDLENLNVSEECFDEIMGIVEELISETSPELRQALVQGREDDVTAKKRAYEVKKAKHDISKANNAPKEQVEKNWNEKEQADKDYIASISKKNRAKSLVDRLNNRVKITKEKWVDKRTK